MDKSGHNKVMDICSLHAPDVDKKHESAVYFFGYYKIKTLRKFHGNL